MQKVAWPSSQHFGHLKFEHLNLVRISIFEFRIFHTLGLLNISRQLPIKALDEPSIVKGRECSKKHALSLSEGSIQQGRSHFDARSVLTVREHGKRARTPLAAFFNIP